MERRHLDGSIGFESRITRFPTLNATTVRRRANVIKCIILAGQKEERINLIFEYYFLSLCYTSSEMSLLRTSYNFCTHFDDVIHYITSRQQTTQDNRDSKCDTCYVAFLSSLRFIFCFYKAYRIYVSSHFSWSA